MAITRRFIQTRPNTDVEFYSPNEESMNKITEYVNLGKTSGVVTTVSEDNLTKTISITFDNINELDTFKDEITIIMLVKEQLLIVIQILYHLVLKKTKI